METYEGHERLPQAFIDRVRSQLSSDAWISAQAIADHIGSDKWSVARALPSDNSVLIGRGDGGHTVYRLREAAAMREP